MRKTPGGQYKTILLGDSGVGKTSLFIRLTQGCFQEQVDPTLQMDIGRMTLKVPYNSNISRSNSDLTSDSILSESQQHQSMKNTTCTDAAPK